MSLRGNGLECPVDGEPGAEAAESAGETVVLLGLAAAMRWEDREEFELVVLGEVPVRAGLMPVAPGCTLMTPAAIPPDTGNNKACGGANGSA